ncbi:hypothetical protein D3C81_1033840 [compost metagenome]
MTSRLRALPGPASSRWPCRSDWVRPLLASGVKVCVWPIQPSTWRCRLPAPADISWWVRLYCRHCSASEGTSCWLPQWAPNSSSGMAQALRGSAWPRCARLRQALASQASRPAPRANGSQAWARPPPVEFSMNCGSVRYVRSALVGSRPTALTSSAEATQRAAQASSTGRASHHGRRCSSKTSRLPSARSDR